MRCCVERPSTTTSTNLHVRLLVDAGPGLRSRPCPSALDLCAPAKLEIAPGIDAATST